MTEKKIPPARAVVIALVGSGVIWALAFFAVIGVIATFFGWSGF